MVLGMEPVLIKARQYITKEPYRSAVLKRLGSVLFYLAVSEREPDLRVSLSRLRKAREVSPDLVKFPAYAIGAFLIVTRIGPFVFGELLKPIRQFGAKLMGMRK